MLDDSVKDKILEHHRKISGEGKLLSRQQLDQYYATFRSHFGPDRLASLDGEALLNTMHETGNRDSLVYWLEFKNDDEFPTPRFGSIAGGSALKFRVFRRKETGMWQAADERNNPSDISTEEAVAMARSHRDQLLRGVELLDRLSSKGSDDDYRTLQQQMDRVAPDVSDLGWGHKYFSLLFPERLDSFHSSKWQRFVLLKLLQKPPEGRGRYICAGRFAAAAHEVNLPMITFDGVVVALYGGWHRYWRIGTRAGDTKVSHWQMMQDRNCIAVGWNKTGDLSWVEAKKGPRERLKALLEQKHPNHPSAIGNDCSQITHFVAGMNEGDIVLAADGATILGIGRVTGEYSFDPDFDFPHQRPVDWLDLDEWKMSVQEGLRSTVREIRKHAQNILETERRIQNPSRRRPVPSRESGSGKRGFVLAGTSGRIQSVLERKAQVILYGPPGTGKTYWAEKSACDLASYWGFGKAYDELSDQQRQTVVGTDQAKGLVRICCFHPAYGYEDFIEGYRPETVSGQVVFNLRSGVFKQMCKDADSDPNRRYYLVVDEINRGDIPRIFGELLTVLEKDKRGKAIVLPISREVFRVPQNVFLIGTMNTADRSISLLDAALRRRFGFVELMPDSTVLEDHAISGIPLGPWFDALNRRICEHVGRDARNLQIGHSYLLQGGRPVKDFSAFKRALRDDIIPLLEEYCYEDFSALQNILGNALVDVEKQRIRQELFDEGHEEDLVQALLEPCPDISTTAQALASDEDIEEEMPDDEEAEADDR